MQGVVWKICDFQPISRFISEMIQDGAYSYYGMWIGNRTQAFEWYHFQWSWVIFSDIAKYPWLKSSHSLCDSWASCTQFNTTIGLLLYLVSIGLTWSSLIIIIGQYLRIWVLVPPGIWIYLEFGVRVWIRVLLNTNSVVFWLLSPWQPVWSKWNR